MRDFSPLPMEIAYAMFASSPAIPRKSSASPPATCSRFHVLPLSSERRITPLEPEAQTAIVPSPSGETSTALTARRLVSMPLVWTVHHWARATPGKTRETAKTQANASDRMGATLPRFSDEAPAAELVAQKRGASF